MRELELKIPPPIVLILCGIIAWLLSPLISTPLDVRNVRSLASAVGLMVLAIALAASGILAFRRVETTIDPLHPDEATALVTSGVFQFSRNPMYLAMLLLLTAWVTYLGHIIGIAALLLFVWYITRFQIRPEEQILASKFGDAYSSYCGRVRRWI